MNKYKNLKQDDFDRILEQIIMENLNTLISIPGVYEAVSEEFNNDVLSRWETEYAICPVCNEPTTIDDDGELLLCEDCANCKSEATDRADHLNRCDW